jgi:hypothetical protein
MVRVVTGGAGADAAPDGAVVVVNGEPVGRGRFDDALGRTGDPAVALARTVEEELLLQRALELDLPRQHNGARASLLDAMAQIAIAENLGAEPDEATLRAFFDADPERFAAPRLVVERLVFSGYEVDPEEARLRAERAHDALIEGEAFAAVRARLSDQDLVPVPVEPLEPRELARHLGPTLVRVVLSLAPSQISAPVAVGRNTYILRLVERIAGEPPRFETIRARVAEEYLRERNQTALAAYLDWLRERATIVYPDRAGRPDEDPAPVTE